MEVKKYEEQREDRMKRNELTSEKCGTLLNAMGIPGERR